MGASVYESTCCGPTCVEGPTVNGQCLEHYFKPFLSRAAIFKPRRREDVMVRFLAYCDMSGGPNACWHWTTDIHPRMGTGSFFADSKLQKAHRFAYEYFIEPLAPRQQIIHTCCGDDCPTRGDGDIHNRCVNPRHLTLRGPAGVPSTCARCGEEFAATHRGAVFCSVKCRSGFRLITKTCPVCGKDFTIPRSNENRYQTCSMACKNKDTVYIDCERCGKRFPDDTRQRWNRHYCSEACRRPPIMISCRTCGKEFRKSASDTKRQFCSISCVRRYMGETQLEARVRIALEAQGVGFHQEYPFGRWSIDFAIPKHKVAIEADGAFWHTILSARDARRDAAMAAGGWKVVRLAETDVYNAHDLQQFILDRIRTATGLELADIAGPFHAGSRQVRRAFRPGRRRAVYQMKGQDSLF